jgi:hypothetical protein
MKSNILNTIKLTLLSLLFTGLTLTSFADSPPPPPGNPSQNGNGPVGGGASLEHGVFVLFALGAVYGGTKIYVARKKRKQE